MSSPVAAAHIGVHIPDGRFISTTVACRVPNLDAHRLRLYDKHNQSAWKRSQGTAEEMCQCSFVHGHAHHCMLASHLRGQQQHRDCGCPLEPLHESFTVIGADNAAINAQHSHAARLDTSLQDTSSRCISGQIWVGRHTRMLPLCLQSNRMSHNSITSQGTGRTIMGLNRPR